MARRVLVGDVSPGSLPEPVALAATGIVLTPNTPAATPPNDPTIGTMVVTAHSTNLADVQWPVTMSATGTAASRLVANIFDATNLLDPLAAEQTITTGIGLGATLNVSFTNVNALSGVTPREFVLRVEVF